VHLDLGSPAGARRAFSLLRAFDVPCEVRTYRRRAFGQETRSSSTCPATRGAAALPRGRRPRREDGAARAAARPRRRRSCCRRAYLRGALLAPRPSRRGARCTSSCARRGLPAPSSSAMWRRRRSDAPPRRACLARRCVREGRGDGGGDPRARRGGDDGARARGACGSRGHARAREPDGERGPRKTSYARAERRTRRWRRSSGSVRAASWTRSSPSSRTLRASACATRRCRSGRLAARSGLTKPTNRPPPRTCGRRSGGVKRRGPERTPEEDTLSALPDSEPRYRTGSESNTKRAWGPPGHEYDSADA